MTACDEPREFTVFRASLTHAADLALIAATELELPDNVRKVGHLAPIRALGRLAECPMAAITSHAKGDTSCADAVKEAQNLAPQQGRQKRPNRPRFPRRAIRGLPICGYRR